MTLLITLNDFTGPLVPSSWTELVRVVFISVVVYAFVIASHRVVGKRAASQMNNFDWIVTVAMGAITGSTILSESITLVEGLLAVFTLLALQYAVTRATVQWSWFRHAVQAGPRLLYYEGVPLKDAMKRERVTESEVLHAARDAGHRSLSEVSAVVLEADGTLSVLPTPDDGLGTAAAPLLSNVNGLPDYLPPIDDPARIDADESSEDDDDGSSSDDAGSSDAGTPLKPVG
ncbi:DUF421 domain-containing protein [Rubrivirga sp.]|uniref:DUF421 domain-containing protein n=1 Tax=Rubrivirga sp. TaxID=1885344 RepID=UPI003B51B07A